MQPLNPPPLPTLPMHLLLSMGCWLSSPFALQCAKKGLLPWKQNLPPSQLENAVQQEVKNRASELLSGVLRYYDTPYVRATAEPPVLWRRGNARLLDYGQKVENPQSLVLFIPSLINRYYVLDLEPERSFLRYMAAQGHYPLVLDWGAPGAFEEGFDTGDYITDILLPAIEFLANTSGQKLALSGYCMGGVLALAAAQLAKRHVSSLALLATPWDFHCKAFAPFVLEKSWRDQMERLVGKEKHLPAELLQALFYLTDPWVFEQKFRRYAELDPASRAAKDFVALEHWVNDGVPMTAAVARDCLIGWAQDNALVRGQWQVAGQRIDPKALNMPAFIAIPQSDHVVPLDCALPLAELIPHAKTSRPSAGHVGMIVGSKAKRELWQPYAQWLSSL